MTKFILDLYYLIAFPMIAAGVCLLLFGGRNPTTALALITTSLVGTIWLYAIYALLPPYTPSWSVFLIMYFSYGNGAALGLGATMSPKIGVMVCGGAFGFFVGLMVDLTLINRFVDSDSMASTWTILGFVGVFSILSIPMYDYSVILSSCVFGSYMTWRVSLLIITLF